MEPTLRLQRDETNQAAWRVTVNGAPSPFYVSVIPENPKESRWGLYRDGGAEPIVTSHSRNTVLEEHTSLLTET